MCLNLPRLLFATLIVLFQSSNLLASDERDSVPLEALFRADQDARSPEQRAAATAPTLQEERERRIKVFELIAGNRLQTADDYLRAGIILHHTSAISDEDGTPHSLGAENHLLAFFLFKRAAELEHEDGRGLMAAAYNYYLRACGQDSAKFGFDFVDRKPVWRPDLSGTEKEEVLCGFDPRPHLP